MSKPREVTPEDIRSVMGWVGRQTSERKLAAQRRNAKKAGLARLAKMKEVSDRAITEYLKTIPHDSIRKEAEK